MTPAAIEWRERMIAKWSARAGELRLLADATSLNKAAGLEWVVAGLQQELARCFAPSAAVPRPESTPPAAGIERLRQILASSMPRRCTTLGVMVNDGPIMDAVRARLQARIDNVPYVPTTASPRPTVSIAIEPPAEVVPFQMGPQISLFGEVA